MVLGPGGGPIHSLLTQILMSFPSNTDTYTEQSHRGQHANYIIFTPRFLFAENPPTAYLFPIWPVNILARHFEIYTL